MITNDKNIYIITSGCALDYDNCRSYILDEEESTTICNTCDPVHNPNCGNCVGA